QRQGGGQEQDQEMRLHTSFSIRHSRSHSTGKLPDRRTTGPDSSIATSVDGSPPGNNPPSTTIASSPASRAAAPAGSSTGGSPLRLALVAVSPCPSAASSPRSSACPGTRTANVVCPIAAGISNLDGST